ncbi:MAG: F0F1 ATP synthase subunit epsilon [Planctomycetes bacterium]|nr:F0F1 ATP synthase subunit epsilon [Planctomycetota bacterium]
MKVEIFTPGGALGALEAKALVAPASEGQLGVLDHHAPMLASLSSGKLIIRGPQGDSEYDIDGGVLQVVDGNVTVLTERATLRDK